MSYSSLSKLGCTTCSLSPWIQSFCYQEISLHHLVTFFSVVSEPPELNSHKLRTSSALRSLDKDLVGKYLLADRACMMHPKSNISLVYWMRKTICQQSSMSKYLTNSRMIYYFHRDSDASDGHFTFSCSLINCEWLWSGATDAEDHMTVTTLWV